MPEPTIHPDAEQIEALTSSGQEGPIVMLNLLRFKEAADGLDSGVSGEEAFGRYGAAAAPYLEGAGARVLSAVKCDQSVIGPAGIEWHVALLVEYPSRKAFIEMVSDPGYLEISAHRTAALADSRLILSTKLA